MMIAGINSSRSHFPFTASQWHELEQQLLTYKYIMSGIPVPTELFSTVIRNPLTSSSAGLFPLPQSLPFGWGCFQMGYRRKIDPEPGRCRRTDGKKWRCSKEACADSKYCEKHMHRGKNKSKKQIQVSSTTTPKPTATDSIPSTFSCSVSSSNDATTCPYMMGHKTQAHSYQPTTFYPFLSPESSSDSTSFTQSTQNFTAPHWLLDPESYNQPKREMRYL